MTSTSNHRSASPAHSTCSAIAGPNTTWTARYPGAEWEVTGPDETTVRDRLGFQQRQRMSADADTDLMRTTGVTFVFVPIITRGDDGTSKRSSWMMSAGRGLAA
nr:hypothetical protein [Mycolicibacterium agri]